MRIILNTIITGLLYTIFIRILSKIHLVSGDSLMRFGFILIAVFLAVCFFHLLLNIYTWTNTKPSLILQVFIFCSCLIFILMLVHVPDLIRHQTDPDYVHYRSFTQYFRAHLVKPVITAICFSITIPLVDIFIRRTIPWISTLRKKERA